MYSPLPRFFLLLTLLVVLAAASRGDVTITPLPNQSGYNITTGAYRATLDATGALTSLVISGEEFLAQDRKLTIDGKVTDVPAVFASQHRQWNPAFLLTGPVMIEDKTVKTQGDGWQLTYTFEESTIVVTFGGFPKGALYALNQGYPNGNLDIWMSPKLHRATDALAQGDLGWPVRINPEPGNYTLIAANGAGVEFQNTFWIARFDDSKPNVQTSRRGDFILFAEMQKNPGPIVRRIEIHPKVDLGRSVELSITSPNPDHLFTENRPIVFPVRLATYYGRSLQGKLRFEGHNYVFKDKKVSAEMPIKIESGAEPLALDFAIQPTEPGHYIGNIIVTDAAGQDLYMKRIGFLYQPQKVAPVKLPEGFDEFWDKTLADLEKVPLDLTLTELPDKETTAGKVYLAKFRAWEGRWAWAWLYEPKKDEKVEAAVQCPAVSVYQPGRAQPASGNLAILAAVHGGDITDYPAKSDFDYMSGGIADRETTMLRYSFTCLVRCYDIISRHRLCNGTVHVRGGSQGGGLSVVLGGLRPAASITGTNVAMMRIDWTILGLTTWGPRVPTGADPQKVSEVIRYFDPACFAHRIKAPVKLYVALFDFTGPVQGILTAINALPRDTPCQMVIDPYGGHFTSNYTGRDAGNVSPIPRWQGTAEENKLNP